MENITLEKALMAVLSLWTLSTIVCGVFTALQMYDALSKASWLNLACVIGIIVINIIMDHKEKNNEVR